MDNRKSVSQVVIDRLCKYIGEQNLTQYELAMRSGLAHSTIKSIMQRKTKSCDLGTVILLCKGLGIHVSEFVNTDEFVADNLKIRNVN